MVEWLSGWVVGWLGGWVVVALAFFVLVGANSTLRRTCELENALVVAILVLVCEEKVAYSSRGFRRNRTKCLRV